MRKVLASTLFILLSTLSFSQANDINNTRRKIHFSGEVVQDACDIKSYHNPKNINELDTNKLHQPIVFDDCTLYQTTDLHRPIIRVTVKTSMIGGLVNYVAYYR